MTRLGALDALARGVANLRGNAEVALASALGSCVVMLVVAASLLPWLSAFGLDLGDLVGGGPVEPQAWLGWARAALSPTDLLARFGAGLVAFALGLTVASFVYCWYWGGVIGLLAAGDAQAPPGAGRAPLLFRTWSMRYFVGEANRLAMRFLLFLSLFCGLLVVVLALMIAVVVAAMWLGGREHPGAALAIGCGGLLPAAFAYAAVALAAWVGQVALVGPRARVGAAARTGFRLLGRRLGACVALAGLYFVAAIAVAVAVGTGTALLRLVLSAVPTVALTVDFVLTLLQFALSALMTAAFAGAFVALVRSELALEAAAATA